MMTRSRRARRATALAGLLVAGALALTGCAGTTQSAGGSAGNGAQTADGPLLTVPVEDRSTFVRNFNPFSPNAAPMTQQAIYEPLFIQNAVTGEVTPWLATEWETSEDGLTVTFTLREGVLWSDGEPLVAQDVATTFALSQEILGGFAYLDSVEAVDEHTAVFHLNRAFSPALYELSHQVIAPDHVWSEIDDPALYTNTTPVGTGPFTEILTFQGQSYDLGPNPHYWQAEQVQIPGVRMLAFGGNDAVTLAAASGDLDWVPGFIPNIEDVFVARNPEHHYFWFPSVGSMVSWQLNTTKAPFDDVAVRKALSMAIDRELITAVGMDGHTIPADCTGLSARYDSWRDASVVDACDWTTRDVEAANALLDEAGYPRGADGKRALPDGSPFTFRISVGSASTDWLSVANIISQNLADIGVTGTVDAPDWSAVVGSYEDGSFETGIVWSNNAATPFQFYRGVMSTETVRPVGTQTFENYHRFGDPTADELLSRFAATSNAAEQRDIVNALQALFSETAPVIPLFPGPQWGAFNSSRFEGWPTAENPYATLGIDVGAVKVLTTLRPVTH